ncbi:MarR family winged helix-turn-helix transcriptional regulator [Pseudonocardia spinosispora]|uniref:MarR family winged helix-turn-helix transcriptional regulator n=1 Tax=Pseudonocardia spinosispora TaxID=103441 RepID=UPI0003FA0340|nr:MarR family transcriptional regulator [Pseudonocardia spinosispora]
MSVLAVSASGTGLITDLAAVAHLLERRLDHALSEDGLTARQYRALRLIAAEPGISRILLAKALYITPQAVGGLTQRLHSAELIDRVGGESGLSFTITPAGAEALATASPLVAAAQRDLLARLPTGTLDTLTANVHELLTEIEHPRRR